MYVMALTFCKNTARYTFHVFWLLFLNIFLVHNEKLTSMSSSEKRFFKKITCNNFFFLRNNLPFYIFSYRPTSRPGSLVGRKLFVHAERTLYFHGRLSNLFRVRFRRFKWWIRIRRFSPCKTTYLISQHFGVYHTTVQGSLSISILLYVPSEWTKTSFERNDFLYLFIFFSSTSNPVSAGWRERN